MSFGNFDFDPKFYPTPAQFIANLTAFGFDFQVLFLVESCLRISDMSRYGLQTEPSMERHYIKMPSRMVGSSHKLTPSIS